MGVSRILDAVANLLIMVASAILLGTGIWLATKSGAGDCVKFIDTPLIVIGAVIFVVSSMGFIGSVCGIPTLLMLHLVVTFIAMWTLLAFTVFTFLVTNQKVGSGTVVVAGNVTIAYKVHDFSDWLQVHVIGTERWNKVQSCMMETKVCNETQSMLAKNDKLWDKLKPIQAGCCFPPASCGFTQLNSTYWIPPASPPANNSPFVSDCQSFSNNASSLCFNCDTCKAATLKTVRDNWRSIAFLELGITISLFVLYSVGCFAFRSARRAQNKGFV